ncbi:hypothetical protein [Spirulina major]|jgi:hypothetical protein|uniref:hypothetical protein n=1 Tax=Spirulina major TaxID=270636 RepID=UPI0009328BB9|nr:hypothetical protein [Spirulina major]
MTTTSSLTEILDEFHNFCRESTLNALRTQDIEVREALIRRQIPPQKVPRLESTYTILVKLGAGITLRPIRPLIIRQIEAAAAFLRDFQIGVLGQRTTLFQLYEIEILIEKNGRLTVDYSAGKLIIQIPVWRLRVLKRPFTYQDFRQAWNRGQHLPKQSPLNKAWWLLNPLGEFRSNLKSTLILAIQKQILGLDKLLLRFGLLEATNEEQLIMGNQDPLVPKSFRQGVIAYLKNAVNEQRLGVDLELVLESKDDRTLLQLLRQYKNNLTNPENIEEIIDVATLTLQDSIRQDQSSVDVKMFGFVNVGNYHRIDVELNLSAGYWRKYVDVIQRNVAIKALQFGLINVYTIDDITVTPNFHRGVKLDFETAALEKTMKEL